MRNSKYIQLLHSGSLWLGAHSCCLLDENFMKHYSIGEEERTYKRIQAENDIYEQRRLNAWLAENQPEPESKEESKHGAEHHNYYHRVESQRKETYQSQAIEDTSEENLYENGESEVSYDEEDQNDLQEEDEESEDEYTNGYRADSSDLFSSANPSHIHAEINSSRGNDALDHDEIATDLMVAIQNPDAPLSAAPLIKQPKSTFNDLFTKVQTKSLSRNAFGILQEVKKRNIQDEQKRNNRQLQLQIEAKEQSLPRVNIEAIEFGWLFNDTFGK